MASLRASQLNKENASVGMAGKLDPSAGGVRAGMKTRGALRMGSSNLLAAAAGANNAAARKKAGGVGGGSKEKARPALRAANMNKENAAQQAPASKAEAPQPRMKTRGALRMANNGSARVPLENVANRQNNALQQQQQQAKKAEQDHVEKMEVEETESMEIEDVETMDVVQEEAAAALVGVEDIDKEDKDNPQLACEYVNEIYEYMRRLEAKQFIKENYLELFPTPVAIRPKMRNMLVDWLVEVHQQFNLLQETLYLTVATIDRFLQIKATIISTKQLQLVGVTAMFVACKYEEMYPPEIGDFVYITDHAYTASQIRQMEISMMEALSFDFGRPLPLHFLRRDSKAAQVDAHTHALAKYSMELTLTDYRLSHLPPSLVAAASLAFALRVLNAGQSLRQLWSRTLEHYTAYKQGDDLWRGVQSVAEVVQRSTAAVDAADAKGTTAGGKRPWKQLESVGKKYRNKKFMKISLIPELRTGLVDQLASGEQL